MKILLVGGTFDEKGGRRSKVIDKIYESIGKYDKYLNLLKVPTPCDRRNGGHYNSLENILKETINYDVVFWFPNVPNDLEKIRDVKSVNPKVILVTSKRNDDGRYSDGDLVQKALKSKSNLMLEFRKTEDKIFNIRVLDPLANLWYDGTSIKEATFAVLDRLVSLVLFTRQGTIRNDLNFNWIKRHPEPFVHQEFIDLVKSVSSKVQSLLPEVKTERFVGNCSVRGERVNFLRSTRCSKLFPSYRSGNTIYMSKRNVSKDFICKDDFVPVHFVDGRIYYFGENKPSVDTPVQVRLYQSLPNINYMIHTHCYVKDAPFTSHAVPCGAIEEVYEILNCIGSHYGRRRDFYAINLRGHGSIIMGRKIKDIKNLSNMITERPFLEDLSTF